MQPNVAGQQNSGLSKSLTATRYSYSYRELINNRRKDSYMKKLATVQPEEGTEMSQQKMVMVVIVLKLKKECSK